MDKNEKVDKFVKDVYVVAFAAVAAIILVGGVDAVKASVARSQPAMGDIIVVKPQGMGVNYSVSTRLPDGRTCAIGTGPLADGGGSVEVVGIGEPDSKGIVLSTVAWRGTGRSIIKGEDCGQNVDVAIPQHDLLSLRNAANGIYPAYDMPPDNGN